MSGSSGSTDATRAVAACCSGGSCSRPRRRRPDLQRPPQGRPHPTAATRPSAMAAGQPRTRRVRPALARPRSLSILSSYGTEMATPLPANHPRRTVTNRGGREDPGMLVIGVWIACPKCGRSGSLAGLRLCMVMHVGNSGGSRAWQGLLGRRPDWEMGPPGQRVSAKDPYAVRPRARQGSIRPAQGSSPWCRTRWW